MGRRCIYRSCVTNSISVLGPDKQQYKRKKLKFGAERNIYI